jgi:hypothetical protein
MMPLLAVGLLATVLSAPTPAPTAAAKPRGHGNALSGTVTRVEAGSTLVVREGSGRETSLRLTTATHVKGALKAGARVAVRWLEKDGHKIATSVRVEPPAIAESTPTVSTPGSR